MLKLELLEQAQVGILVLEALEILERQDRQGVLEIRANPHLDLEIIFQGGLEAMQGQQGTLARADLGAAQEMLAQTHRLL
jgi:hypothetical protein